MLRRYFPFYEIALRLQTLRSRAELYQRAGAGDATTADDKEKFRELVEAVQRDGGPLGLTQTVKLATRVAARPPPDNYVALLHALNYLNDALTGELEDESLFRIIRKDYFERDDLFGPEVTAAFPSCTRDIQKSGSCYALEQEDACVHHLMLVLERGLNALAAKFQVPFDYRNWQPIIGAVDAQVKSLPPGKERHFYQEVVGQFGFLKDAYRNHASHVRDDPYDLDKALSIFNHVRDFMRALAKGGLAE